MSYIQHVLQPGEEIRYQGSVHWILYLPAIILCVIGAVSMGLHLLDGSSLQSQFLSQSCSPYALGLFDG